MKLFVYSIDPQGRRWLPNAQQRVRAVLRRLASVVQRVELRLDDTNGPLPGVDKRCQVEARLPDGATLRADATSRSWGEAVELATAQLRRRVLDALSAASATLGPRARVQWAPAQGGPRETRTRPGGQRWR